MSEKQDLDEPTLAERAESAKKNPDALLETFIDWTISRGLELYPAQEEAILEIFDNNHIILNTPTGSGKSLVAVAMHFKAFAEGRVSYYTSPIKALVTEKFFDLCKQFGAENVGMFTGDATVNPNALIICCTQEILASLAMRRGEDTGIDYAIIDEFHYYADRDRGLAWQLPLLTMPTTTFMLMSATIGDPLQLADHLEKRTGRSVAIIQSDQRPVPLTYQYSTDLIVHTIQGLVEQGLAPLYVVNFSQRETAELAQSLMSLNFITSEEKQAIRDEISDVSFDTPYGNTIKKYLTHGHAVHHGGLIPKYRRAVERLGQKGLIKVISGTDTLGVGINLPLRTVVFSKLCKFDGVKVARLKVRDFKQIAGRAGRKGYDNEGLVVCQAPEYVIENLKMEAKFAGGKKKFKKLSPPTKNFVDWNEDAFLKLANSESEALSSRFTVNHAMLLELLQRSVAEGEYNQGYKALIDLISLSHESNGNKARLRRKARMLFQSLREANLLIVEPKQNGEKGQQIRLDHELQDDFSIHHSLSLYLVDIAKRLNPEAPDYHLSLLSYTEAILEDPRVILYKQQDKARDEAYRQMKNEGLEYEERQEKLEEVTYPQPLKEEIHETFMLFTQSNPWVSAFEPSPKSIARDMYERYVSFNSYVKTYGLERSEGVLLRYLTQVYKTLRQNIPEECKTELFYDVVAYLREVVARTDSSIIREWADLQEEGFELPELEAEEDLLPLDADPEAFRARIRAEMRSLVSALSEENFEEASGLIRQMPGAVWTPSRFERELLPFKEEYGNILFDHEARRPNYTVIKREKPQLWSVMQILCDREEDNMWFLRGRVEVPEPPTPEEMRLFILEEIGH